jgi:outer membrane biosynthesis protein TonB
MVFRRLLERHATLAWYIVAEGYTVSFAAHALLIGGWLFTTDRIGPTPPPPETFTPAEYLIPRDRLEGMRPKQERVSWTQLAAPGGQGQMEVPSTEADREQLKYVKPKGEAEQEEKSEVSPPVEESLALGDSIHTELVVDSVAVRYEDSAAPPYPEAMLKKHIEGTVLVQYVVDTSGFADTSSFKVLYTTHKDFASSVRRTLPFMRFRPALMGLVKVKQLVQQPFAFRIVDSATSLARTKKP